MLRSDALRHAGTAALIVVASWLTVGMHVVHPLFHRHRTCCHRNVECDGAPSPQLANHHSHGHGTGVSHHHGACPICTFLAVLGKYALFAGAMLVLGVARATRLRSLNDRLDAVALLHTWARGPPSILV